MFLQTPTPDTSGYMIAGYIVAFVSMALYVASLLMRRRNLDQDLATLEEMDRAAQEQEKKSRKSPVKTVTKKNGKK